jgi:tetratricopeptide (TPR) repeat protein
VAVATLTNETGDATLEPLGRLVAERIVQGIQQHGVVEVVPPAVAVAAAAEAREATDRVSAFAEATGARVILHGAYYLLGDSLQFQLQITDAAGATVLVALQPVTGPHESATETLDLVRERALPALAAALDFRAGILYWPIQPPNLEVYRVYRQGFDAHERDQEDEALSYYEEASVMDATFLPALIGRAEILNPWWASRAGEGDSLLQVLEGSRGRMNEYERLRLQLLLDENVDDRLRTNRRLAALTPRWSYRAGVGAWNAYRPREALEYWARVDTANAHFVEMGWYWRNTLLAHHMLNNHETELELARAAPRDYGSREMDMPALEFQSMMRGSQIRALAALGRSDEIDVLLDSLEAQPLGAQSTMPYLSTAARELRAHGYRDAALAFAQRQLDWLETRSPGEVEQIEQESSGPWYKRYRAICLLRLERYEENRIALEELLQIEPENAYYLGWLGWVEALLGNHERARAIAEQLAQLPGVWDYEAVIAAALGEREEAMRLLREQFQESGVRGLWMWGQEVAQTTESLRGYPPFEEFLRPRG